MQYNGYELQISENGCFVRDNTGKILLSTPDENDAKEFIDNIDENFTKVIPEKDLYDRFVRYCKKLPGRMFFDDGKMATVFKKPLDRYIKSFEKLCNVEIYTSVKMRGGETYYVVDTVF